ncbi:hypothetical protein J7K74_02195 [Candidatus Woesearchaeota archaeon]|nr:hypothetical protein [Candidatus Woesearchaeota archaeon]
MRRVFILIILLVFSPLLVIGVKNSEEVTLLTVSHTDNGLIGGTANLYVKITPGSGRIYIDTYPLSRLDTIESIRIANKEACRYSPVDCKNYDFYYNIKTSSPLVGGPSAGGFIAITTLAMLYGLDIKDQVSMSGTVTSGGVIGPVEGLKEKALAAMNNGKNIVLVPRLALLYWDNNTNTSKLNETLINSFKRIKIIPIGNIIEGLGVATSKNISIKQLTENKEYENRMYKIAKELCERSEQLTRNITSLGLEETNLSKIAKKKYEEAMNTSIWYVRASLCFNSNIYLQRILMNATTSFTALIDELEKEIDNIRIETDSKRIKTINDLQTVMVVKERLREAEKSIENCRKAIMDENKSYDDSRKICIEELSYAKERIYSAKEWGEMYGIPSKKIEIDKSFLENLAIEKILEGEERAEYLEAISYGEVKAEKQRQDLEEAKSVLANDPALALYLASKAVAEINSLLSTIRMDEKLIPDLTKEKLRAAEIFIANEEDKGFPFMGYSYYAYGEYLLDKSPLSSLIYAEYALEFSSMSQYFPEKELRINTSYPVSFGVGLLVGLIIGLIIPKRRGKLKKAKKRKRRK